MEELSGSGRAINECWGPVEIGFWDQFLELRKNHRRRKDNRRTFETSACAKEGRPLKLLGILGPVIRAKP
jgi:hypothetical protein